MKLKDIEKRLAEIKNELANEDADITALQKETDELLEQRAKLMNDEQTRKATLEKLANQNFGITVRTFKDDAEEERVIKGYESEEYRSAFYKNLLGLKMTEAEERAFVHTTENTGAVIPKELQNRIYSTMQEQHPILNDVTILQTGTVISIVKHTAIVAGDAKNVAEGVANDDEQNTFVNVDLSGQDISKHVDFSYRLGKMAIPAFENYLVQEIGQRIGSQWAKNIVAQIKSDLNAENKIDAATAGTLALEDVLGALATLKGVGTVNVYVNNATLYGQIALMKDTDRRISFIPDYQNGIAGQILGKGMKQEDALEEGELLILDPTQYIENVVQDLLIERDKNIKTHVHTIAGLVIAGGTLTNDKAGALITVGEGA